MKSWGKPRFRWLQGMLALFFSTLLVLSLPAFGQERFGEINGTATDPSGAVLPNVTVTLRN